MPLANKLKDELDDDDDLIDQGDAVFNARAYLKKTADEYKELNDRYDLLAKQYEEARSVAVGRNTAALDRTLAAVEGEDKAEKDRILKLVKEAKTFLDGFLLKSQFDELHQLSSVWSYVSIIRRALDVGDRLKSSFENGDWSTFVRLFVKELSVDLEQPLSKSKCTNLFSWISRYADAWRKHGAVRISSLIAQRLESASVPQDVLHADKKLMDEIRPLARALFDISKSDSKESEPPSSIVARVLLRPFVKRFVHHFCGGKDEKEMTTGNSTKSITIKPEWYLSIVVKWHRQFTPWIDGLNLESGNEKDDRDDDSRGDVALFFARGLVDLARRRLKADLLQYANDDPNFLPHLIDEAVAFDNDMKGFNFAENEAACIDILIEPGVFELWTQLEQNEATKCLDVFLNQPEAWILRYGDSTGPSGDLAQVDSNKVPYVTDNVLLLLTAMKHRFRHVRSHEHRRIFVQIQCTLLHEFRDRLADLSRELVSPISPSIKSSKKQSSSPTFAHLVNSCSYVCAVLAEWQESPAYLGIRTACFDDIIDLFDHTKRTLLRDACTAVLSDLTASVDEYRRSFSFYTGRGDTTLSSQATVFLYTPLQEAVSILNQSLNRKNFSTFARQLAIGLEKMLIERVVLELRLDQKSGEELQRQLGPGLVKVTFDNYGVVGASAWFARLTQYLHIASMNAGNCMLLKEALKEKRVSSEHVLSEMGLENIGAQEVEDLLQRRSDLM